MMGHRDRLIGGQEWDAFSWRARRVVHLGRKVLRHTKVKFNRRARKEAKRESLNLSRE